MDILGLAYTVANFVSSGLSILANGIAIARALGVPI